MFKNRAIYIYSIFFLLAFVIIGVEASESADNAAARDHYQKGRLSYMQYSPKGFQNAIQYYNLAIQADPSFTPAYAGLGEVYSILGYIKFEDREDYESVFNESFKNTTKAMGLSAGTKESLRALAMSYLHLRRLKDAELAAKSALEKDPNDAESQYILWAATGRDTESPYIKRALELNPKLPMAYLDLGKMYFYKKNDYANAVKSYLQAINVAPECPLGYNYLGTVYRTQGYLGKSRDQYLKAIELDPGYASAYMNLAITFLYMGKLNESIDYQRKAIALNPNYPDSYYYLGLALDKTNSPTEAIRNYQTFLNLVGTQERYYTFIQSARENMGRLYDNANGVNQ